MLIGQKQDLLWKHVYKTKLYNHVLVKTKSSIFFSLKVMLSSWSRDICNYLYILTNLIRNIYCNREMPNEKDRYILQTLYIQENIANFQNNQMPEKIVLYRKIQHMVKLSNTWIRVLKRKSTLSKLSSYRIRHVYGTK